MMEVTHFLEDGPIRLNADACIVDGPQIPVVMERNSLGMVHNALWQHKWDEMR